MKGTLVKLADGHYIVIETGVMYDRHYTDPKQMVVSPPSFAYCGDAASALADWLEENAIQRGKALRPAGTI